MASTVTDEPETDIEPERLRAGANKPKRTNLAAHRWTRRIHVYTSMICFLVVLFFAITGITLNHPNWTFGTKAHHHTYHGTLPKDWRSNGTVDWLRVAEYLRSKYSLRGVAGDQHADDAQGSLAFKGPGYAADAFLDVEKGTYDLTVESQGFIGVINDLHKGRDSNTSWKWVIDVSGGFLAVVSLSGLLLQQFLRKRRRRAYITSAVGAAFVVVIGWLATR